MQETSKLNDSYVYVHRDTFTGEIVYVGMGCGSRCISSHKRSPEHAAFINEALSKDGLDFVSLPHRGLSNEEARRIEKELIQTHKPKFNKQMNGACNAGRGNSNHNSKFTPDDVAYYRAIYSTWTRGLRAFHRERMSHVSYSSARKLLTNQSYA